MKRIIYRFREFDYTPQAFKGMSPEEFGLIYRLLDETSPAGFRKAHGFVVIESFCTRLGVIDCFVN